MKVLNALFALRTMFVGLFLVGVIGLIMLVIGCGENDRYYYGPLPCVSDEQCVEDFGEGWYCEEVYLGCQQPREN